MTDTYVGPFASAKTRIPSGLPGDLVSINTDGDLVDSGVASTVDPLSNDDSHIPTTQAMQSAILAGVAKGYTFQGEWDASGGTYPSLDHLGAPITMGDFWRIIVGGVLPGDKTVEENDEILALTNIPGQNPSSWAVSIGTGVRRFNGRSGVVLPQADDYSLDMITGLPAALDAKSDLTYVDSQLALKADASATTAALALKANLSGPTFTGTVTVPTPSNSTDASTKGYVDTGLAGKISSTTGSAIQKANGSGGLTAAISGTDYQPIISLPTLDNLVSMTAAGVVKDTGVKITTSSTSNVNTEVMTSAAVKSAITTAGAGVSSFNTRTGAVVSATNDYAFSQISGAINLTSQVSGILPNANTTAEVYNAAGNTPSTIVKRDTSGSLQADYSSSAGTANLVSVIPDTTDTLMYPIFASSVGASFQSLRANSNFNYNAVTNILTVDVAGYAKLNSPTLTGSPKAPTQTAGDNSTNISTTQYTDTAVANIIKSSSVVADTPTTLILDFSLVNFVISSPGNRLLGTPTNVKGGQSGFISVRQDATGSRLLTYDWPFEFAGGAVPVLSTNPFSFDQLYYNVNYYMTYTATISLATPGVITTSVGHNLFSGQKVRFTTTGALPTGISANTTYWVNVTGGFTFNLATSLANLQAGTYVATSGTQSGVHTVTAMSITISANLGVS